MKKAVIIIVALLLSTLCSTFSYASNEIKLRATGYYIEGIKTKAELNVNFDVTHKSDITSSELNNLFKGTGLDGLGSAFIQAQDIYGINAEFLSAIAIEESGWGRKCANSNNLFGIKAAKKIKSIYAAFKSKKECVEYVAKHLSNNYIRPGQKYFYKSAAIKNINHYYCELPSWKYNLVSIMKRIDRSKKKYRNIK